VLTSAQRAEFEGRGFVRLRAAFSRAEAAAMEARVWRFLERRYGAQRDAPGSWPAIQATGLRNLRGQHVFEPIGGEETTGALDDLLGVGAWKRPSHWGSFLVNFPSSGRTWRVPSAVWHTDFSYVAPSGPLFGALLFSFLSDVPPGAGGTAVVAGSHRVIRRFVGARPKRKLEKMKQVRLALLRSDPWLECLASPEEDLERHTRLTTPGCEVDGVPVQVEELSGEAGDVIVGHPWLLHAGAPNCGERPRLMCVQRIRTADGARAQVAAD
jgi:hypothetical protein